MTLSGNKGAEGMFWALYEALSARFPQARFNVASYYPKRDLPRAPKRVSVHSSTPLNLVSVSFFASLICGLLRPLGLGLPGRLLPGFVRAVKQSDILLDAAGVSFSDGREVFLPFNVLSMLPAVFLRKPAIKCSQALGPFEGKINHMVSNWFLPKLSRVFARGEQSLNHLKGLKGVRSEFASDLVFLLEPKPLPPEVSLPLKTASGGLVGISPSSLVEKKSVSRGLDYCGTLAGFISSLLREGEHEVILIPHSIRPGSEKTRNNDLPTCRRIKGLLGDVPGCHLLEQELSPAQLKTAIAGCDYFVASRFHSMVGALSGQVPLLVCGWGHKYLEVLDEFDLGSCAFNYRELCFETLRDRFDWLVDNAGEVRSKIQTNLPRIKELSGRQIEHICTLLDSGSQAE